MAIEHRAERENQRIDAEAPLWQERRAGGPTPESEDYGFELHAPLRQLVDPRRGWSRQLAAADDCGMLELLEPLRENVRADARQTGPKVGKALGAEQQLPHHQQGPSLPDQSEPMRGSASIVIVSLWR